MLHVTQEDEGQVEVWTVDRPRAANALDGETLEQLGEAIHAAERRLADGEMLRGIVLAAAGRGEGAREVFLSGADLREVAAIGDETIARTFSWTMMDLLSRLEQLPCLVVAAISGDVYGGGCEVALACDVRIAEEAVLFAFRQTRVGVASGWGGTTRLPRIVGLGGAKRLLLAGIPCNSVEALRLGLVDEVVERGEARARALEVVRACAAGAPLAVAAMKQGLLEALELDRATSFERELERFVHTWRSADHREGLASAREKRPPKWTWS